MPLAVTLLLAGLALNMALMAAVWAVARRIRNNGIVDVAWAGSFTVLVAVYLAGGHAGNERTWLLAMMVGAWSVRLTWHLHRRVMGHHPVEDSRYQQLRKDWAHNLDARFFVFFQAQAVAASLLSIPHVLAFADPAPGLSWIEWTAAGLWAAAFAGEAIADAQLAAFKRNPASRGRTCDVGLWRYSRHPNYFFEWLIWCAFALFALASPYGWLGVFSPLAMLYLLLRVTGIPAAEEASLASRGDEYRRYQQVTSAFVPWFRRA